MLPDLRAEGDFFTSGGGFADLFSADLAGYALPTQLHPVLGGLIRSVSNNSAPRPDGSQFPVNKGQQIYVGYVALALAAVGLWSGRRRSETWFWAFSALVFFLLTLGPSLRVAGYDLHLPLPFDLIARLPFFKGNRYPSRYSVMLLLSLAPLVALGGIADCGLQIADHFPTQRGSPRFTPHASRITCYAPLVYLSTRLPRPVRASFPPAASFRSARTGPVRSDRGRGGGFRRARAAARLAEWRSRGRQAGHRHHAAALEPDEPRQATARRQHLPQPGIQVPVLQRRPDAGPADRADQCRRRAPA